MQGKIQINLLFVQGLLLQKILISLNELFSVDEFFQVTVRGSQGHAGTVPMSMRQDPMAATAELIVLLESLCKHPKDYLFYDGDSNASTLESLSSSLVCTVGEISTWPSASNVIPGQVRNVSLDALDSADKSHL